MTYYNSLGYTLENGNIPGVSLSRFNLTSKTSYQINKLLKVGVSIFANRRKNTTFLTDTYGLTNPVYYSRIANPYFEPFDNNNNYLYDYDVVTGSMPDLLQGYNILEERENTSNKSITTAINSIFDIELRFKRPIGKLLHKSVYNGINYPGKNMPVLTVSICVTNVKTLHITKETTVYISYRKAGCSNRPILRLPKLHGKFRANTRTHSMTSTTYK